MQASAASSGVTKYIAKLQRSVAEGNYYEAHQQYHSISSRFAKQSKLREAVEMLLAGIELLSQHGQSQSAIDLTQRLWDLLSSPEGKELWKGSSSTQGKPVSALCLNLFSQLDMQLPEADAFAEGMVKLSIRPDLPQGDPAIHHAIAYSYYRAKEYYEAESHFILGIPQSAKAAGAMAHEWSERGDYPKDPGYFLARIALPYLARKQIHHANLAIGAFMEKFDDQQSISVQESDSTGLGGMRITKSRLVNFCQLLVLVVCKENAASEFQNLGYNFRSDYEHDSYLVQLVEKIADEFFQLGPKKQVNPFQEMLKSMFTPTAAQSGAGQIEEMD